MKILIVEDEKAAARQLADMLLELEQDADIVHVVDSVKAGRSWLQQSPEIDLILSDVQLKDGNSFELLRSENVRTPVIFVTGHRDYALKAFKLNSVDYLLKPLQKHELASAISKFKKLYSVPETPLEQSMNNLLKMVYSKKSTTAKSRFLAKAGTRLTSVATHQIAYFYTRDRLQYIKTISNEDYVIDKRLDEIETEIDTESFFRVNRQFIVNYSRISKVNAWFSGKLKVQVEPVSHEEIVISRLRAASFRKWLGE